MAKRAWLNISRAVNPETNLHAKLSSCAMSRATLRDAGSVHARLQWLLLCTGSRKTKYHHDRKRVPGQMYTKPLTSNRVSESTLGRFRGPAKGLR